MLTSNGWISDPMVASKQSSFNRRHLMKIYMCTCIRTYSTNLCMGNKPKLRSSRHRPQRKSWIRSWPVYVGLSSLQQAKVVNFFETKCTFSESLNWAGTRGNVVSLLSRMENTVPPNFLATCKWNADYCMKMNNQNCCLQDSRFLLAQCTKKCFWSRLRPGSRWGANSARPLAPAGFW